MTDAPFEHEQEEITLQAVATQRPCFQMPLVASVSSDNTERLMSKAKS